MGKRSNKCQVCKEEDKVESIIEEGKSKEVCQSCYERHEYQQQIFKSRYLNKCMNCKKDIKDKPYNTCVICGNSVHKSCINKLKKGKKVLFGTLCTKDSKTFQIKKYDRPLWFHMWGYKYKNNSFKNLPNLKIKLPNKRQFRRLRKSFTRALNIKKIKHTNELIYINQHAKPEYKNEKSDDLKNLIEVFKDNTLRGLYPPLEIVYNVEEEFTVKSTSKIPKYTLITEYCGQVGNYFNLRYSNDNSIFTLREGKSEKEELVVRCKEKANLGRFINSKTNGNLSSVIYTIDGLPRIFLIANKDIKKDEYLYYNYDSLRNNYFGLKK